MNFHVPFRTSHMLYDHLRKLRGRQGDKKDRGLGGMTFASHLHTWYWLLCDKFSDLLIWTLFAVKPQALCGINLRSTTVVCWQVHSPMGDPSSRVENKKRKRKKVCGVKLPQSKIWDNISSVSILKWEKSSWWRWMIFRKWRIEVCWTAPWFFNLWINSRVFGRKSENSRVDLAIRRNSPTIAE